MLTAVGVTCAGVWEADWIQGLGELEVKEQETAQYCPYTIDLKKQGQIVNFRSTCRFHFVPMMATSYSFACLV